MDLTDRQARISDLVRTQGHMSVDALADVMAVTPQTIRRDIQKLADLGILRRRHGGVENFGDSANLAYRARTALNYNSKRLIARAVATLVPDGASLAFGIGTTPEIVAQELANHRNLRVFTNNLNVAGAFCANGGCEVTIAGGRLRNSDRDILGAATEAFFEAYYVDYGVFGVGGVDADGSLLDFDEDEVRARHAIMRNCRKSLLVLDHSKFGRIAHVRGGDITDPTTVICDRRPPEGIAARLDNAGVILVIAGGSAESPGTSETPSGFGTSGIGVTA